MCTLFDETIKNGKGGGGCLTKDFGPGKGRKQLQLATYIPVQLPEVLMKLPKIIVSLPYYYLKIERTDE